MDFRDPVLVDLSDTSESAHDDDFMVPTVHEEEHDEAGTNFAPKSEAPISPDEVRRANFQLDENGKIVRPVELSDHDVNELKNNPLIMFSGYRYVLKNHAIFFSGGGGWRTAFIYFFNFGRRAFCGI